MPRIIQADYDALANLANQFSQEAVSIQQLTRTLSSTVEKLTSDGWKGKAADAFTQEMHQSVLPKLNRLSNALDASAYFLKQASTKISEGEQEAQALFQKI
jgi:WXG100 family type VII secretion target